jgi:malate dehydrogenase (oxaloacetate-decarboxylating)
MIQWEDFAKHKAFTLLDRYRDRIPSFDDDIQGTGAVALAALITAMRIKKASFADQRFLIVGLGQAGAGIAMHIRTMLRLEGLSEDECRRRIFAVDQPGLLLTDTPGMSDQQRGFAQDRGAVARWQLQSPDRVTLDDVVRNAKPTVLVGVTAQPGLFSQEMLAEIVRHEPRPVVLALSNPTSKSECSLEDVVRATDGRGFIATGSPFPEVTWKGRTIGASQCNNLFVFPGVGLGTLVARSPRVTDAMFFAASRALSALVTPAQEREGLLLPPMGDIRRVSRAVAKAVAVQARDAGLGRLLDDQQYEYLVAQAQWMPRYAPYRAGRPVL